MEKKKNIFGIDSMIIGIISIFTVLFWYICLPLSIYALVRGIICSKKTGSKFAKTGFILSLISITLCVLIYTQTIAGIALFLTN